MASKIEIRVAAHVNATVERVYEGDNISVTLAAFEYAHQADLFAKVLSKKSDGAIVVRGHGRNWVDDVFVQGKKVRGDHWARNLHWADSAK